MERQNPYLMLGLPFGASREEATQAFARRSRAAKVHGNTAELTGLTWALQQIDAATEPPGAALAPYRIPADPTALHGDGPGVFAPPAAAGRGSAHDRLHDLIRRHAAAIDREDL
jgi:hypothetical protein